MVLPVMNRGGARTVRTLAWGFRSVAREHRRHRDQTDNVTLHHPVFEGEVGCPDWACPP
jgi:hypothetical protein